MADRPQHSKGPRRYHHGRSAGRQHDRKLTEFERLEREYVESHGMTPEQARILATACDDIAAWQSLMAANPSPLSIETTL